MSEIGKQNTFFRRKEFRFFSKRFFFVFGIIFFLYFLFCLPSRLFQKPHSTVVYARGGELLSAIIATDGQWRFPDGEEIPDKFKKSLLQFEDKNFYDHSGVFLPSLVRALAQNIRKKRIVSGGSTITMQTIRLSAEDPPRTIVAKIKEIIQAMRLEWSYSKEEILALYAANAPYGGNVVGIEAAAWRYFGRSPNQLSWAESATLAVLPNAPSLIFPGKNQEKLLAKRNRVLKMLLDNGEIEALDYELSLLEQLPQKPFPLPQKAPHVLNRLLSKHGTGNSFKTTIDYHVQQHAAILLERQVEKLRSNLVFNAAMLIIDVKSGEVLTYLGNSSEAANLHANQVDVVMAPRSTGSILKPFLYAAMLKEGRMMPNALLSDIPIQYDGFAPKNYSETFGGAVPAGLALSRSLNVPAVAMLKDYSYHRFHDLLRKMKFSHLTKPADHYGLSLILGGGEASLWDIAHAYAAMARELSEFSESGGKYLEGNESMRFLLLNDAEQSSERVRDQEYFPLFDAGSIWCTYKSLLEVNKPETELGWEVYDSYKPIAWKTGTSFGNRDAWAVGTTPEYVVAVWIGNSDGQGRPQLTGVTSAAPLMFDVFSILPRKGWFITPYDDLERVAVCSNSGMRVGMNCEHTDTILAPRASLRSPSCQYHKLIHTDGSGTFRVNMTCSSGDAMIAKSWFVLPSVQAYYYKRNHPEYKELPPFAPNCVVEDYQPIGLIYPRSEARVYVPKNLTGKFERIVLQASHQQNDATLFWHWDDTFIGETKTIHQMEIGPEIGIHKLTLVDEQGNTLVKKIELIDKN